jgi:two-component system cell cycle response regulator
MTDKKILIVEDDPDLLRGLEVRLKASGYTVSIATEGLSAISVAQKETPDLILLDIGLPSGDGFSVMERLKNITHLALVPVVIITGRDPQGNQQRAMDAGAKAFLQKPIDNDVLLRTIRGVLRESGVPVQVEEKNGKQAVKKDDAKAEKKILVVEDDPDLLRGLEVRLKASGYTVFTAADAKSAVSAAQKQEPDVILLDIGLPDSNGFAVMKQLKSLTPPLKIPVVIITGRDPLENEQRAIDSGVQAFLRKPIDNYVLLRMLSQILRESDERKKERNRKT